MFIDWDTFEMLRIPKLELFSVALIIPQSLDDRVLNEAEQIAIALLPRRLNWLQLPRGEQAEH